MASVPQNEDDDAIEDGEILDEENSPAETNGNVFDRHAIETDELEISNLPGVQAYSASTLEKCFVDQATHAFEKVSKEFIKKPQSQIFNLDDQIAKGELTPFELLQRNKEKQALEESEASSRENILKAKKRPSDPSPSTSSIPAAKKTRKAKTEQSEDDDESAYDPETEIDEDDDWLVEDIADKPKKKGTNRGKISKVKSTSKKLRDDGNDADYNERIRNYQASQTIESGDSSLGTEDDEFHEINDNYKINAAVWNKLYKYQKTGVRWLYELHEHCVGGILADEMGLGKTVQMAVFLRSIAESYLKSRIFDYKGLGPTLIVCPTTLMHQWVKELNTWFPLCRVMIFHSSGAFSGRKSDLIEKMAIRRNNGSVMITSYDTLAIEIELFSRIDWYYAILDEGHKIRNPNARVTLAVKELRTPHRIILSGSPMQNNLKELWSLIDFVYPGRLGSLKDFTERFAIPITQGGYANATTIQVRTAFKCAVILRDAINPYMLRRMKKDVEMAIQLPEKVEQVLFCDITPHQRSIYREYIGSEECRKILSGTLESFVGLCSLRKICNHPDLLTGGPNKYGYHDEDADPDKAFGAPSRSGKMIVVESLLSLWHQQGHKVLLFSQSKQMLTILEKFVITNGYQYLRMDGGTPIGSRQTLVNNFNSKPEIFIFLLTTRVGGLGINLTGANRVLIFDPDWNPSTDVQARERAWRIGQHRAVTIYRLLTSGTIEEKIYQRQIFKQFLANRILVDPKQKRFFKTNDLNELFVLGDPRSDKEHGTETAAIFCEQASEVNKKNFFDQKAKERKKHEKKLRKAAKKKQKEDDEEEVPSDLENDIGTRLTDAEKSALMEEAQKRKKDKMPKELKKKERKEKKKSRRELFDGKFEVPYLKKQKRVKEVKEVDGDDNDKEGKSVGDLKKFNKEQDDYVLGRLLSCTGVHSALRHDEILNENSTSDMQLIEDEAESVAKRAAAVLKQSKRRHNDFIAATRSRFQVNKSISNGSSSVSRFKNQQPQSEDEDESKPEMFNGGMKKTDGIKSGTDLLAKIRARKAAMMELDDDVDKAVKMDEERQRRGFGEDFDDDEPSVSRPVIRPLNDRFEKLADQIRSFFIQSKGKASTNAIMARFQNEIKPSDSFIFKSMLNKVATLITGSIWVLKSDYK